MNECAVSGYKSMASIQWGRDSRQDINKRKTKTAREEEVTDTHLRLQLIGSFMGRCEAPSGGPPK